MIIDIKNIHSGHPYKIKDKNKAEIFHLICSEQNLSRKVISQKLNIRPATASNFVNELIEDALVFEQKEQNGTSLRGRPEKVLSVNFNKYLCISMYVDTFTLNGALVNLNEDILYSFSIELDKDIDNEYFLDKMLKLVNKIISKLPKESTLLGIGLCLTGYINKTKKELNFTSRWHNIKNVDFSVIEKTTGYKVQLHQKLNSILQYMIHRNTGYKKEKIALLHWGHGIGAAYSMNGQILSHHIGGILEIGHVQIVKDNPKKCNCGSYGCLETVAALWTLRNDILEHYPTHKIDEKDIEKLICKNEIFEIPSVAKAAKYMAYAIHIIYNLLRPDRLILSGPLFNNKHLLETVKNEFKTKYTQKHIPFSLNYEHLPSASTGVIFSSTFNFFESKLREKLQSRYSWK
jgi:predicted NBD/HSP70 family sugar kinase